ncbi:nucleotide exchange factor GrpE [Corallococcus sp. H22C18031201]|uniref:nucleotide exchange factor GrpE n=1 Tax=Citreicoccus inhibens TaxID=2849499 RepID=UPI000E74ACF3|nr:nucleotide exchange factor GrpE [Citreicoccus inhibens]MBU8897016.1 nucleotide exchange factor GrpE [Citreicoccus inhibens]RJS19642.1 nucleotide exchange factor GrpE [Corallococcus sp. H22C18031201]
MTGNTHNDTQTEAAEAATPTSEGGPAQDGSGKEATPAVDVEKARLQAELDASRRRVDELARAYQALNKDREEFKQRLTRERERMIDVERGDVAVTLLEAIDELDRALNAGGEDGSALAQGVRMIRDSLLRKVQAAGIERLQVVGQPYDPNLAEAADMEITPVPEDDQKVVAEVRAGYRLKDRIIRPARVKVAKYIPPANA